MKEFSTLHWVSINETTDLEGLPDGHYELKFKSETGVFGQHILLGVKSNDFVSLICDNDIFTYGFEEIKEHGCEYRLIRATNLDEGEYIHFDRNMLKHRVTSIDDLLNQADQESLVYQLAADVKALREVKA